MSSTNESPIVTVTGANGLVGVRVCAHLTDLGARVRAVVRRRGTAPEDTDELVGDFHDPAVAAAAVEGAQAVISTVHPMGSDLDTQRAIGVQGTLTLAQAARDASVERFVHVSTAAVYDRAPKVGDVDEASVLVDNDSGDYPVTKREADAALAELDGITRILVRPPAILGSGESSVWNSLRPSAIRDGAEPRAAADATFAWVHVDDLASLLADLAVGRIPEATRADDGPVTGGCTPVNVAGEPAQQRDYYDTVTSALGVEPVWDTDAAWTGSYRVDRARSWGWQPGVELGAALAELHRDVRALL